MLHNDPATLSDQEYLALFRRKVEHLRVPLTGELAITHRCNLRCVHCYIGSEKNGSERTQQELNTSRFISILDEITEAGCLFLVITGGEPLLRDDFKEIYRHAKMKGLLVTLFTNGTLMTDEILAVLDDLPPFAVEISIYGATATTYEKVTGVQGSFRKCMSGIEGLLERKINLRLKTVLMTLNIDEFSGMEALAAQYGVKFRVDAGVFPRLDGDRAPVELRIPPEEAVAKEFLNRDRLLEYKRLFDRFRNSATGETLYPCGAGVTHFHVDSFGNLQPCLMVRSLRYDLARGDFLTGWREVMPDIRNRRIHGAFDCGECEKRVLCGFCPAFFDLENGSEQVKSDYLCAVGHRRFEALMKGGLG